METYFDSHLDLLQRSLQKHRDRLKSKAEEALKFRSPSGVDILSKEVLTENFDREVKNFKLKVRALREFKRRIIGLKMHHFCLSR